MIANPPPSLTSPPWSGKTKRTIALIALGLVFLLALQLLQAWSVVIVALVLSYLLNPLVNALDNYTLSFIRYDGLRRGLSVFLTFLIVIFMLMLVVLLIIPPIAAQMEEFGENLPEMLESTQGELEKLLSRPIKAGNQTLIIWDEIENLANGEGTTQDNSFDLTAAIQGAASTLTTPVVGIASLAFSFVFNTLVVIVLMFYLMKDGSKFVQNLEGLIPIEYQGDFQRLVYELAAIWNAYLRGQLLLGLIVGTVTGLGATILGLPQPLVLGLLAGLLEFIPNLGPIMSSIPAILFALVAKSTTIPGLEGIPFAIITTLMYVIIQQTEALFLVPRVMGRSLDLHPFVILVAVLSGAAVAGLLGIILAAPIVATMRLVAIYIWAKLVDIDPFAENLKMSASTRQDAALPSVLPHALKESFSPPQRGEIVNE